MEEEYIKQAILLLGQVVLKLKTFTLTCKKLFVKKFHMLISWPQATKSHYWSEEVLNSSSKHHAKLIPSKSDLVANVSNKILPSMMTCVVNPISCEEF